VGTVLLNIALAPALIFGWPVGRPLGVAGAALASFISLVVGCVAFGSYFQRAASPIRVRTAEWRPQPRLWSALLRIGLPAGGEFALMSVYAVLVYSIIRPFGAAAQAGFGIGIRVVQSLFLPVVAIAFAASPVAGQNYGARLGDRVRQTFYAAAGMATVVMVLLTGVTHFAAEPLIRFFNGEAAVVAFGSEYLRIVAWNFVLSGIVFVSSNIFQGLGNTLPPLGSSALRLILFALPAFALSHRPGFQLRQAWYLSVATVAIQCGANAWMLHREFMRKLSPPARPDPLPAGAST
jgi:MATE family, multidrug efflux pump